MYRQHKKGVLIMMNFINESMQRVESTFYEMTHVTEVGSYGYNMANFTAFCIWFLIVIGVIGLSLPSMENGKKVIK